MTPHIQRYIRDLVDEDCSIPQNGIYQNKRKIFYSVIKKTTIYDCLNAMHSSINPVAPIHEMRNDPNTIIIRKTYSEMFSIIEEQFPFKIEFLWMRWVST
ncbi:hypothetical protein RF11_01884 [Thelohanellus kitauei]|uniref:Uncharacterized protein n=1 Tax=Thelohanellus kitauei TaxID=669202 RepID=A0A0C2IRZ4_THEKT|nr:hypothetical protein RF11_01884 [Thelohanellus kitauei]